MFFTTNILTKYKNLIQNFLKKIFEVIFPNHCLGCNKIIDEAALFCNDHWQELKFITQPKCKICSQPFNTNFENNNNLICLQCLENKPFYDASIIIFCYNNLLKKIIGHMKYHDATNLCKKFGQILAKKIILNDKNYNLIIAVPLHRTRLRQRKFNQAILLAKSIIKNLKNTKNKPEFYTNILLRQKYTSQQARLDRKAREKNLKQAFLINKKYLEKIKNANILLIDDVVTTGSTLNNCAQILKKAGAKNVDIATIAKTILTKSDGA